MNTVKKIDNEPDFYPVPDCQIIALHEVSRSLQCYLNVHYKWTWDEDDCPPDDVLRRYQAFRRLNYAIDYQNGHDRKDAEKQLAYACKDAILANDLVLIGFMSKAAEIFDWPIK